MSYSRVIIRPTVLRPLLKNNDCLYLKSNPYEFYICIYRMLENMFLFSYNIVSIALSHSTCGLVIVYITIVDLGIWFVNFDDALFPLHVL